MKNPIYVAYYSHENDYCYKIDLPWSKYAKDTVVLCKVSEGYGRAKVFALSAILNHFNEVTVTEEPKDED